VNAGPLAARLAQLGPYFALQCHEPRLTRPEPWLPLAALLREPAVLTGRIGQVRAGLAAAGGRAPGQVEFRVAASVAHLGVSARLLAPALGAEVLGARLRLDPGQLWWVPELGGPFRLSVPVTALTVPGPGLAAPPGLVAGLLAGPVSELTSAVAARSVSPRSLWGNVASAIGGAAAMISAARPDLAPRARAAAAAALGFPALAGASDGPPGTADFRRRSCCLIYRLAAPPDTGLCGDCVLGGRPGRAGQVRTSQVRPSMSSRTASR
jgi:hypothetical protein